MATTILLSVAIRVIIGSCYNQINWNEFPSRINLDVFWSKAALAWSAATESGPAGVFEYLDLCFQLRTEFVTFV